MPAETMPDSAVAAREPLTLSRLLTWALVALVGAVLVDMFFEGWVEALVGTTRVGYAGRVLLTEAAWPKLVKNVLFLALAGLTVLKVALDRRWRDFTTGADIALAVLIVVLIVAGLINGSGPALIAQALYVYLRGVIVFYALRAALPPWRWMRPVLLVVGGVIALNVVLALAQMVIGPPIYRAFGWVDLTWANTYRAQGLLNHPNHLGHVLALAILGVLAWSRKRVDWRWWTVLGVLCLAMSATQSRESIVATCTTAAVLWLLGGLTARRMIAAVALLAVFTGAQIGLRPDNRAEWGRRLDGVVAALRFPTGAETPRTPSSSPASPGPSVLPSPSGTGSAATGKPTGPTSPAPVSPAPSASPTVPAREIRVLYFQQGARLLAHRPVLGYGIGQFGGIVAQKNDADWNLNPAFGPGGFDRHGFQAQQVDSFWLHLVVEAGLLGLLAYLVWLVLLAAPMARRTRRFGAGGE